MVVGDLTTGTELLVIGGGPGGYVAAIRGAQLGMDVMLVEMEEYGGTCLNHGCIPSKALVSATDLAHRAGRAERMGVFADPAVDLQGMIEWKDSLVDRLTTGIESLCKNAGVTPIEGRAEFAGQNTARIVQDEGTESVEFEHAVVATGSRPTEIAGFSFEEDQIIPSREALALESVPERMVVVGAGYIGMELATVYQKLGCDVTILEQFESALPGYEDDVTEVVRERAEKLGVSFRFGFQASEWQPGEAGLTVVGEDSGGERTAIDAEVCLVAVGREPVTETLNLGEAGIETDETGSVRTDEQARTSREHIFAVGDVSGEPMLAHAAFTEGAVAAEVAAGEPAALDYQAMPAAVFTDPEIGTVGMTEAAADEAGFEPVVGQMPLRASGRALTLDEREGFVRVVADEDSGFLLGAQIVAPEASELIAEVGVAIEMGATLADLTGTVHTHPTLSEAIHEAVKGAHDRSIHY